MKPPHAIDTRNATAVADAVKAAFAAVGGQPSVPLLDRLFGDTIRLFAGEYPGYQAVDMVYHDLEHTLQATVCLTHLLEGRRRSGDQPRFTAREWELAVAAALLHDSGYLKLTGDTTGTGAKYTFHHERRSCDFARNYLPGLGFSTDEIEDVCAAILCTGPKGRISRVAFRREEARHIAFLLVTADYLAQMSDVHYVDKLAGLFREFEEAYEHDRVPVSQRQFTDLAAMIERTPAFWTEYVRPMLDFEAAGVHRYLSETGQPNLYLQAVDANLLEVERRQQSGAGRI